MAVISRPLNTRRTGSAFLMSAVGAASFLAAMFVVAPPAHAEHTLNIDRAEWRNDGSRLRLEGHTAGEGEVNVTLTVRGPDGSAVLTNTVQGDDGEWEFRRRNLSIAPCTVEASQQGGGQAGPRNISGRPAACDNAPPPPPPDQNQPPVANDDSARTTRNTPVTIDVVANDTDSDGTVDPATVAIVSGPANGNVGNNGDGTVTYGPNTDFVGTDSFQYTVQDNDGAISNTATVTVAVNDDVVVRPDISINSTSQNAEILPSSPVPEEAFVNDNAYRVFAVNDLGMHCGDLDTRVSSILPPFNVIHAQVIRRGSSPDLLSRADGIEVLYSAASNPDDPALANGNLLLTDDGYKTNFWDVARQAYAPFYPPGILAAFYPPGDNILDLGLPVPDVERLYLGDGQLTADQQAMPGRFGPYLQNDPQPFHLFVNDLPFFLNFPFGYVADNVSWFEAAGIPVAAFDDFGLENPYPLMRVQAEQNGNVVASVDTVTPISGEANCQACHTGTIDGGNGAATAQLANVADSSDDPEFGNLPQIVSIEWASDVNILRLHDLKHGSDNPDGAKYQPDLVDQQPVVCQRCHYTPALDLAQVGPKGPADADANGREQVNVRSMSNVMHSHHASVTDTLGAALFPEMPPPVDEQGRRDFVKAQEILGETCYMCHPGERTQCLRGAMFNAEIVCQDCHGEMAQVGDDFTRNVTPDNPGAFELAADFYTNPATPRVPWANEPGCGSCHTGDATNNLAGAGDTIAADDGIRLLQAFREGDGKATPIVPSNKRFAENTVASGPAAGNPKLYRVSVDEHGGLFCEACHGSTHAEWPNANPNANDNLTSIQLQGHAGTITECSTCHTGDLGNTLDGPHGMHPVGDTEFADGGHDGMAEDNPDACRSCHGQTGQGTVLSRTAVDRNLPDAGFVAKGTQIGCGLCHDNELAGGG